MAHQQENQTTMVTKRQQLRRRFFPTGNYAYVCTRVKAKRARLLPNEIYLKLLIMDLPSINRFIGEGQYKREIAAFGLSHSDLELLEHALTKNMVSLNREILGFCTGDLHTMVETYLQRWDVLNLKTVLRGKWSQTPDDDILKNIVAAGAYSDAFWHDLVTGTATLAEITDTLKESRWHEPLLLAEEKEIHLSEIENNLEKQYYTSLLNMLPASSKANQLVLAFFRAEIDLVNLKTLLLTKFQNVEKEIIQDLLIPGGDINPATLQHFVDASDFSHFFKMLQKQSRSKTVKEELGKIEGNPSLTRIIRILEKDQLAKADQFSYLYPLSLLPILNYFIRKKIEVENLRIIARGKESGLPEQMIRDMLVV